MSGPATRMKMALADIAAPWDGRFASGRLAANAVSAEVGLCGITPAQLAVMDAAADLLARAKDLRLDLSRVGIETPDTGHVSLTCGLLTRLAEEELCLRLLERAVQRRKEGGS